MAKGTRLIVGKEALLRQQILNSLSDICLEQGFEPIVLPGIEPSSVYTDKAGSEILSQMYLLNDRKDNQLCLRPEGTATLQLLADSWKNKKKDVKLFYQTQCWRYEQPQLGRYREFTQFGVEILNPRIDYRDYLLDLSSNMISNWVENFELDRSVKRGLTYYIDQGWEIKCPDLGAQKQVLGGGTYQQGIGFAIGIDRLCLACLKNSNQ